MSEQQIPITGEEVAKAINHYFATKTDEEIEADIDAVKADFNYLPEGEQRILVAIAKAVIID